MNQTNACKVIVFTETWLKEEQELNNSLFRILNSSLIPHIKKVSNKGCGVGVFIH